MTIMNFLSRFGFESNPFQSTNAAEEPRLAEYFVPPPYFASILGDPTRPKSHVVLAPRGGGKTAQRIMVEHHARDTDDFLCLTYDSFDMVGKPDGTLTFHLKSVTRLLLVAILADISEAPSSNSDALAKLSENDKKVIKHQISVLLGDLSSDQFRDAINSIKNRREKMSDLWDEYGGKGRSSSERLY